MKTKCKLILLDSFDNLADLSSVWDDLLTQSSANTIFLTWDWIFTWSKHYLGKSRSLFVLAIYKKEKLIGIAPWCIRHMRKYRLTIRRIEFLGTPEAGSDYLDVFIKKGNEKEVSQCIYHFLFGRGASLWDSVFLQDISCNSFFLLHFMEKVRKEGKYARVREGDFCPIVTMPRSWDDFLKGLSSNRREQFRRHYRVLQKNGKVKHETLIAGLDGGKSIDRFNTLYGTRWGRYQDKYFFSHLKEFVTKTASASLTQIDILTVDESDVAALLHFRYDTSLFMYLMAVDKAFLSKISVGNILVGLCIEKAIIDGIEIYDFLKGSEDYKFHWACDFRRSLVITLYQRRFRILVISLSTMLKDILRIFYK